MPVAQITNRVRLAVTGEDAFEFLQGLITNDLKLLDKQRMIYSCFLTPQGKFLYDFFITKIDKGYWLDILKDDLEPFKKHLKMYALRSKVNFEVRDDIKFFAVWDEEPPKRWSHQDPRHESLGHLFDRGEDYFDDGLQKWVKDETETTASMQDYDLHRIKCGVPDGSRDLKQGIMTLYDGNIDLLNGLSLQKGCYLGQELTARIHYRGLVKKRLFTVRLDQDSSDHDIKTQDGALAGELLSQQGEYGLALLKLSEIDKPLDGFEVIKPEYLRL